MELYTFLQYRVSMVFLLAFLLIFLQLRYPLHISLIPAAVCFAVTSAGDYWIIYGSPTAPMLILNTLLQAVLVQGTGFLLSRCRNTRTLFAGLTSAIYPLAGTVIAGVMYMHTGKMALALVLQVLLQTVLLFAVARRFRQSMWEIMDAEALPWGMLCLIPVLFFVLTFTLVTWPNDLRTQPQNALTVVLALVLMGAVYDMLLRALMQQRKNDELKHDNELLETYASGLRAEAEAVRRAEERAAILRHDTRHRVAMIRTCLEEGDLDRIRALLTETENAASATAYTRRYCDNPAINGVMGRCSEHAEAGGVALELTLDIPRQLGRISEFEFATVLSNLVENAIHAAAQLPEPPRTVRVRCFPAKAQLLLEVTNPFLGERRIDRESGLPVSRQDDEHGYGMRSVQIFAARYDAVFTYTAEKHIFCVQLLVNL